MDKSTAKRRVFDFMKEHGTSDIEELHENIRCDIGLLIEIIDELCSEGVISEGCAQRCAKYSCRGKAWYKKK